MKKMIEIILLLVLCGVTALAQPVSAELKKFSLSVERNIDYPEYLTKNCIPTTTFIRVVITGNKVVSVDMSDSAEKLFMIEFLTKKKLINVQALAQYCKNEHIKNCTFLLPVHYHTKLADCVVNNADTGLLNYLTEFAGKAFTGQAIILTSIESIFNMSIR